ncbi:hypothetical protein DRN85_10280 [Methanosarcinales archaeon]|nr:MAG: hypothetical protein DRN85_10280 [Methanosarcinales archaeon]
MSELERIAVNLEKLVEYQEKVYKDLQPTLELSNKFIHVMAETLDEMQREDSDPTLAKIAAIFREGPLGTRN